MPDDSVDLLILDSGNSDSAIVFVRSDRDTAVARLDCSKKRLSDFIRFRSVIDAAILGKQAGIL